MLKFRASTLIAFSGLVWFGAGLYLLTLGLNFLLESDNLANSGQQVGPLLSLLSPIATYDQGTLLIVTLGLAIGFIKGKFIFAKTVRQTVERIVSFRPPIPLTKMYSIKYCMLLAGMMLLGMTFKFLGFSYDVRGLIDVAIGSALINGSMLYFRQVLITKNQEAGSYL
ncbi:putative membrane protein [Chlamydiales bacterium STE3]|nr:putative membrane protein [Chlamydiales bacterium STE3]